MFETHHNPRRLAAPPARFYLRRALVALALAYAMAAGSRAQTPGSVSTNSPPRVQPASRVEMVVLPRSVPDPIEPVNRILWSVNRAILVGAVQPTGKAYRFIVLKPVRDGIKNFGYNLSYPKRVVNNLLQAKWRGAGDETLRFLYNSTVGVGGFFDLATKKNFPKSDADFGQTLGQWGWQPRFYLMLPVFGPSNDRDVVGLGGDTMSNPAYIASVSQGLLTYESPYIYGSYGITYNDLAETVDADVRHLETDKDPYAEIQYAWTFTRATKAADFRLKGKQDEPSLETLQAAFIAPKDREFPNRGRTRSVLIPATNKELKFTSWMQPGKAPVVYIVPGLGSHRLDGGALALAELVYQNGFSAVTVSSPYNFEFMEHASTAAMPAYSPVDAHDLHSALTQIDQRLATAYPNRIGSKALMGYSMGGFHSLFIAATQSTNRESLVKFDRFVAIDSPVRLLYGISKLDDFYQAPLGWPADERAADLENTFLKVAALSQVAPNPNTPPPFNEIESRFLIGFTFRFLLRDVIFSSQERVNQGVLRHRINPSRRNPVYQEILQYSYLDYFKKFAVPYYQTRGIDLSAQDTLEKASDLRTYGAGLKENSNVRLILNRNDFLLPDTDLTWLQSTIDPAQITVFEHGGHLGNLAQPDVQKAIVGALDGLGALPQKAR